LMRGREALRKRLLPYVQEVGEQMGLETSGAPRKSKMTKGMEAETRR
jgi:hypothetical protein